MERLYRFILVHPRWIIGVVLALTAFFGWQATGVELNNSIEAVLPEGHPAIAQDQEIKRVFDSRELILIGLLRHDGIFDPGTLGKVRDLTDEIRRLTVVDPGHARDLARGRTRFDGAYADRIDAILEDGLDITDRGRVNNLWTDVRDAPGVDGEFRALVEEIRLALSPVSDVISLSRVDNITSGPAGLVVESPMETVPETEEGLAALASTVFENEMFVNGLVSRDSTGTVILVELSFYYDDHLDLAHALFQRLDHLASGYEGPEEIHLAGVPMVNVYTSNYMSGDLLRLMPLVIVVVVLAMWVAFRTLRGALIPLAVVLASLVWTIGLMAMVGRPITLVVSAMPIILIAIGVADGIHVITEYQLMWSKHRDRERAILATMRAMTAPVIFTSLTDMAGFGSLAISSIASIRDFGIFTSVGVLAALVFSLTFIPAALVLMRPPHGRAFVPADGGFQRALGRFGRCVVRRRRWVVAGAVGLSAGAALLLPRIQVGSRMVGYFKEGSEIVRASRMINEKFGGTEVLNVVIDTGSPDGLKDPAILAKIAALQDTLEARPLVGYTTSMADYIKRIHYVMNDGEKRYDRIPYETERVVETDWELVDGVEVPLEREVDVDGRDLIAQYLLLYENAGGDDVLKLADFDYQKANVIAQIRTDHTPLLRDIRSVAIRFAEREFGDVAEVTFAGCSNLCIVADDLIIPSQLESLGLALVVVAGLLMLIFRSVRRGLAGLLPLALTVLMVFALLSLFGVFLDAVTALIASIVLGIGIDYSVHFLWRYEAFRRDGRSAEEAIGRTMETSGRAIVFNSIAVGAGFLVLLASSFWPVMHIGWIVAANMLIAAALTLTLLPVQLRLEATTAAAGGGPPVEGTGG